MAATSPVETLTSNTHETHNILHQFLSIHLVASTKTRLIQMFLRIVLNRKFISNKYFSFTWNYINNFRS